MKLKKIASLALAGVMAVSMLAGCAGNNNSNSGNTNGDDTVVIPTSAVVDIFNKGQNVAADAQVKFTADSSFEKKVVAAVEELGTSSIDTRTSVTALLNNLKLQTGLPTVTPVNGSTAMSTAGFLDNTVRGTAAAAHDGEVNSFISVTLVAGSTTVASAETAAKTAMTNVVAFINTLPATSKDARLTHPGDDYLNYTYTGNVCAVAATNTSGAPVYVVAYVINQNVALETAPEV